jgi:hypothetical protein
MYASFKVKDFYLYYQVRLVFLNPQFICNLYKIQR